MNQRANRIILCLMAPWVALISFGWWLTLQPPIRLTDPYGALTPEQVRLLESQLYAGEICDPLPCWAEVAVQRVSRLEAAAEILTGGAPFVQSDGLRTTGSCRSGDLLVRAELRDRWWNRFVPFASSRWPDGQGFHLCLRGTAEPG